MLEHFNNILKLGFSQCLKKKKRNNISVNVSAETQMQNWRLEYIT